jgi:hypothetical protein
MGKKSDIKSKNDIDKAAKALADIFNDHEFIRGAKTVRMIKNKVKSIFAGKDKRK